MRFDAGRLKKGWMQAKGLQGDELTAFAVVYSATHGRKLKTVTSQYVSKWLECDELHARRTLNQLADRGLLNTLKIVEFSETKNIYAAAVGL